MADFSSEWAQALIAVGNDPYSILEGWLDTQIYPDLGTAFFVQCYVNIAILAIIMICIVTGLFIRVRRNRFHWFLEDGSLSRPDFKVCVPILWCIYAGLYIAFTIIFVHGATDKAHGLLTGRLTYTVQIPLIWSYAMLSTSVLVSAPGVRRWLISLNEGAPVQRKWVPSMLLLNSVYMIFCIIASAGVFPPGFMLGRAFEDANDAYWGLFNALEAARAAEDTTIFDSLGPALLDLDRIANDNAHAGRTGQLIYLFYIVFFLLTGVIPAVFLNRAINKKISRLESDKTTHTSDAHTRRYANQVEENSKHIITLSNLGPEGRKPYVPQLPADRPFANIVAAPTGIVPPQFQAIIDEQSSPREKARRLRAALRHDARSVAAYALLLFSFLCMTAFTAAKGPSILSAKQDFRMGYAFPAWNFIVPGTIVAVMFLYEALTHKTEDEELEDRVMKTAQRYKAPPISAVQVAQQVDIVYTEERKRDKFDEAEEELTSGRPGSFTSHIIV